MNRFRNWWYSAQADKALLMFNIFCAVPIFWVTWFDVHHGNYIWLLVDIPALIGIISATGSLPVRSSASKPFSFLGYQYGDMVGDPLAVPRWAVPAGTPHISPIMLRFYWWTIKEWRNRR